MPAGKLSQRIGNLSLQETGEWMVGRVPKLHQRPALGPNPPNQTEKDLVPKTKVKVRARLSKY